MQTYIQVYSRTKQRQLSQNKQTRKHGNKTNLPTHTLIKNPPSGGSSRWPPSTKRNREPNSSAHQNIPMPFNQMIYLPNCFKNLIDRKKWCRLADEGAARGSHQNSADPILLQPQRRRAAILFLKGRPGTPSANIPCI